MREFVLYAREAAWIETFDRQLQGSVVAHQVQVMAQTDPSWTVYEQLVR